MRRIVSAAATTALLLVLGVFFFGLAGSASPTGSDVPIAVAHDDDKSCYPNNQFSVYDRDPDSSTDNGLVGPEFRSAGAGTARFYESEVESFQFPGSGTDYSGGKLSWSYRMRMEGDSADDGEPYFGEFGGYIRATIYWDNGRRTTYESECLVEVQTVMDTSNSPNTIEVELEAEGKVEGFPKNPDDHRAMAKLEVKREANSTILKVRLAIMLGSTCRENRGAPTPGGQEEIGLGAGRLPSEPPGVDDDGDGLSGNAEYGEAKGWFRTPMSTAGALARPDTCPDAALLTTLDVFGRDAEEFGPD